MSGVSRLSRSLARAALTQSKSNQAKPLIQKRTATFVYREQDYVVTGFPQKYATVGGFLLALWIGLNCYYQSDHLKGHFPDIIPSEWTDEELGIPPDDEDIYPEGYVPLKER